MTSESKQKEVPRAPSCCWWWFYHAVCPEHRWSVCCIQLNIIKYECVLLWPHGQSCGFQVSVSWQRKEGRFYSLKRTQGDRRWEQQPVKIWRESKNGERWVKSRMKVESRPDLVFLWTFILLNYYSVIIISIDIIITLVIIYNLFMILWMKNRLKVS